MPYAEAIAWLIADALDLPRPSFAALLLLRLDRLKGHLPLDQHWLQYPQTLAFCSSTVVGKHITGRWSWLSHLRALRAFKHPELPRIAAFDVWIDNQDRHTGNFLKTSAGRYIPIDNEYALYTLLWARLLTVAHNSLRNLARETLPQVAFDKFESAMMAAATAHEPALSKASPDLKQFLSSVIADPSQRDQFAAVVLSFLAQRADTNWLSNELGRVA
jgi:hypothetical protein